MLFRLPSTRPASATGKGLRSVASRAQKSGGGRSITTDDAQAFLSWAQGNGITMDNVSLASFGGLRGVAAAQNLEAEKSVLEVPFKSALAVTPVSRCTLPESFCSVALWEKLPPPVRMALILLHERSLGEKSRFAPYIRVLPQPGSFDTIIHWSSEDMARLQYPHAAVLKERRLHEIRAYHNTIKSTQPSSPVTLDDLTWALDCVQSRLFSGPYTGRSIAARIQLVGVVAALSALYVVLGLGPLEQALNGFIAALAFNLIYDFTLSKKLSWYAMCPLIDMINHSGRVQSDVSYQYFADKFTVEISSGFGQGDQVFISYGDKSNDQLLTYYGFAEEGNTNESFVLSGPGLEEAVKKASGRAALAKPVEGGELLVTRQGLTPLSLGALAASIGSPSAEDPTVKEVARKLLQGELESRGGLNAAAEAEDDLRKRRAQLTERALTAAIFRQEKLRVLTEGLKNSA